MLAAGAFFILTYGAANWLAAQRSGVSSIVFAWERQIPFVAWTIIPYWSTDLLFAFSFFICSTRRELQLHAKRLIAAQILCVAVFLLFPLSYSLDHPVPASPFNFFFRVLGSFDKPFNQAPSLHLAITTILWTKYSEHTRGLTRLVLRIWLMMTGVSTLTTYQHHFIDMPTGVWVGLFCLVLFPEREWEPRIAIQRRGWRLAVLYCVGSISLIISSVLVGGLAWLLLWPAGALLVVAVAYVIGSPYLLRSRSGKMSFAAAVLLAPYLAAAKVNSWWWGRNESPAEEIVPGLWLGRVMTRRERDRLQIASVVNLAPELPIDRRGANSRSVPMLDMVVPSAPELDAAVIAIEELRTERPTLVCCALGYSRSATAIVAWLLATRLAPTVDSAIDMVRKRRRRVRLSPSHRAQLKWWAEARICCDQ
jgi:protein-tyrosine phosphatase